MSIGSTIDFHTHCSELNASENTPPQWQATDLHGNTSSFDTVIVTIPTPQILNLKGTIIKNIQENKELLENVRYSSRYALGLFFEPNTEISFPWVAKYVAGNPCIRFVCVDSRKRGKGELECRPYVREIVLLLNSTK